MPVNLNALIRYKTIDKCLRNKNAICTIDYLIEKCSQAIYEATGKYNGVSERTIRNDIRILRSEILHFNAPIVIKQGIYSYSRISFSIFDKPLDDINLLIDIQDLLIEEYDNIKNKNKSILLTALSKITGKEISDKYIEKPYKSSTPNIFESRIFNKYKYDLYKYLEFIKSKKSNLLSIKSNKTLISWKFLLDII